MNQAKKACTNCLKLVRDTWWFIGAPHIKFRQTDLASTQAIHSPGQQCGASRTQFAVWGEW